MTGEFSVLHLLAVKGSATSASIEQATGEEAAVVDGIVRRLAADGHVRLDAVRARWLITAAGRERHAGLRDAFGAAADPDGLQSRHAGFVSLNKELKQVCREWQIRDGLPNDHADPVYDRDVIGQLRAVHAAAGPLLAGMADAEPRFAGYRERLNAAVERLAAGDARALTGVGNDSYHEVWMELHQDILLSLNLEREAGS